MFPYKKSTVVCGSRRVPFFVATTMGSSIVDLGQCCEVVTKKRILKAFEIQHVFLFLGGKKVKQRPNSRFRSLSAVR